MYWDSLSATGVYASVLILVSVAYLSWKQRSTDAKRRGRERWMDTVIARFRAYLTVPRLLKRI